MLPISVATLTFFLSFTGVQAAVSTNGRCGKGYGGLTCAGSTFGSCCSSASWCGSTTTHCGTGCQQAYGTCGSSTPSKPVSTNARCGSKYGGQTCQGSVFGNCCSQFDFCGSTKDYCSASICQKDYGSCTGTVSSAIQSTFSSIIIQSSSRSSTPVQSSFSTQASASVPSPILSTCSAVTITQSATPMSAVTVTQLASASTVTVTQSVSGSVVTVTQSASASIATITQSASASTITITQAISASTVTITQALTLSPVIQAVTLDPITITQAVTIAGSASPATVTLSASPTTITMSCGASTVESSSSSIFSSSATMTSSSSGSATSSPPSSSSSSSESTVSPSSSSVSELSTSVSSSSSTPSSTEPASTLSSSVISMTSIESTLSISSSSVLATSTDSASSSLLSSTASLSPSSSLIPSSSDDLSLSSSTASSSSDAPLPTSSPASSSTDAVTTSSTPSSSSTTPPASSSAAPQPNFLGNGNFETGIGTNTTGTTIPGWVNPIGSTTSLKQRMDIQSDIVHSGSGALTLTAVPFNSNSLKTTMGYMYLIPSPKPTLSPTGIYTFSAWARQIAADACTVRWYCGVTAVGTTNINSRLVTPSTTEWTQTTFACLAPNSGVTHVQVTVTCAPGNAWTQVYLDDIFITANN